MRGRWSDEGDLAALADALHFGRVQRIDLRPALARLLDPHPQRERQQRREAFLQSGVALGLAADVTDQAAEPGAQELEARRARLN